MEEFILEKLKTLFSSNKKSLSNFNKIFTKDYLIGNMKVVDLEKLDKEYLKYFKEYIKNRYARNSLTKKMYEISDIKRKITFTEKFQENLFELLFAPTRDNIKFYHYTTFESAINILKSKKIRFSSLVGLNDISETSYSDFLLNRNIKKELHYKRIESFNSRFVFSNTEMKDDLNQWRLYGDDGKGVCLEFAQNKNKSDYFIIFGKIIYGHDVFTILNNLVLNLLYNYDSFLIFNRLDLWKNFIKHKDYTSEKELRLIFHNTKKYGLEKDIFFSVNRYGIFCPYVEFDLEDLPFNLIGINLGPKCYNKDLNQAQLKYYLSKNSFKKIKVEISDKDHYR